MARSTPLRAIAVLPRASSWRATSATIWATRGRFASAAQAAQPGQHRSQCQVAQGAGVQAAQARCVAEVQADELADQLRLALGVSGSAVTEARYQAGQQLGAGDLGAVAVGDAAVRGHQLVQQAPRALAVAWLGAGAQQPQAALGRDCLCGDRRVHQPGLQRLVQALDLQRRLFIGDEAAAYLRPGMASMRSPPGGADCSQRAATFMASPVSVLSASKPAPNATTPVCTPTRKRKVRIAQQAALGFEGGDGLAQVLWIG